MEHVGQDWYRKELDRRNSFIRYHRVAEAFAEACGDKEAFAEHEAAREEEEELYERLKKRLFRGD